MAHYCTTTKPTRLDMTRMCGNVQCCEYVYGSEHLPFLFVYRMVICSAPVQYENVSVVGDGTSHGAAEPTTKLLEKID